VSFYVSNATFFLLHCDEWDRVVALPRHKFVTGATLLQLRGSQLSMFFADLQYKPELSMIRNCPNRLEFNKTSEWDRVVALPRHKFVTGATLLQLRGSQLYVHITRYVLKRRREDTF
jgi:uncharacterized protein YmfQ (DUF2313 family)